MAIIASFSPAWGSLVALGDAFDNPIELTRNAAGQLFINGGSVTIFGGTPTVTNTRYVQLIGQAGNDVLSVNESSGALPPVTLIGGDGDDTLTGGSGSDTLRGDNGNDTLFGRLGADILRGGAGNDTLNGGDGNDRLFGEDGNDTFVWNPGDDNDVIEGGAGSDTLLFNGANVGENIGISANGGRVLFTRDVANVTIDLNDTEIIRYNALGGADTIVVNNLAGTDATQIDINLGASGGGGDGAADTVIVNGTASDDVIVVLQDAEGVLVLGLAAAVRIRNFEAGTDQLIINSLGGSDVIDASGVTSFGLTLTSAEGDDVLIGGSGNDILSDGPGDDVIIGGPGIDIWIPGGGSDIFIQ